MHKIIVLSMSQVTIFVYFRSTLKLTFKFMTNVYLKINLVAAGTMAILILTSCEHVPTVNVGIPHCGCVDKHQR